PLLARPGPVWAVCAGHALAKGALLLRSWGDRVGAQCPGRIGLGEVASGLTMHDAGIELARARLTNSAFRRSVINAEMFSPEQAVEAGFLDRAVPAEELEAEAMAIASQLTQLNMTAHRKTKLKARK